MIKFSKRTKYALQCLIHLQAYRDRGIISVQQISQTQSIPEKFLSSILSMMKKNGWVKSKQGPSGGYFLTEKAEKKSLKEIIEAMEVKELDTESEASSKEAKISEKEILNALDEIDIIISKQSAYLTIGELAVRYSKRLDNENQMYSI